MIGKIRRLMRKALGPRPVWRIVFQAGNASADVGKPPLSFLDDCQAVAEAQRLTDGEVYALRDGGGLKLQFAGPLSDGVKQRLRNAWSFSTRR